PDRWRDPGHAADIVAMPIEFHVGPAMPIYREISLENLALYQQILRTAERIKTLRREMDDISRELYQRLDDFDQTNPLPTSAWSVTKSAASFAHNWNLPRLLSKLPPEQD